MLPVISPEVKEDVKYIHFHQKQNKQNKNKTHLDWTGSSKIDLFRNDSSES